MPLSDIPAIKPKIGKFQIFWIWHFPDYLVALVASAMNTARCGRHHVLIGLSPNAHGLAGLQKPTTR